MVIFALDIKKQMQFY